MRRQGRLLGILLFVLAWPCGCQGPREMRVDIAPRSIPARSARAIEPPGISGPQQTTERDVAGGGDPGACLPHRCQRFPAVVAEDEPALTTQAGTRPQSSISATAAPSAIQLVQHVAAAIPPESAAEASSASEDSAAEAIATPPESAPAEVLTLREVTASVFESYPLLEAARLEQQVAEGKELASWGEFDLNLKGSSIAKPLGYYKNYRNGVWLNQPLYGGGFVFGGYKIGRGDIEPWYRERETDKGGEFSVGFGVPLLKDRAIDKRRSAVAQAALARESVEPAVQTELLDYVRVASQVYWTWVAAGQALEAQRELLRLAQARVRQIEERVKRGDLERIVRINNRQLIASREAKVIEAERKLEAAAIKLSLFYRDPQGEPIVPEASQLPRSFPAHESPDPERAHQDIAAALQARPEFLELDLLAQQVAIELAQAENSLLPKLDATIDATKDVGEQADIKGDKTLFQLEAGLYGEVPLQRREGAGKIAAARGKMAQIRAKREYVANKVTAEVQDAVSALRAAAGRIERAKANLDLAGQTLSLGQEAFNAGDIDLISLNIYEQTRTDAQFQWIEAQADFFVAQADYRAALALDPLAD